eukprot:1402033-Pyramimonas_sp.AAC.1
MVLAVEVYPVAAAADLPSPKVYFYAAVSAIGRLSTEPEHVNFFELQCEAADVTPTAPFAGIALGSRRGLFVMQGANAKSPLHMALHGPMALATEEQVTALWTSTDDGGPHSDRVVLSVLEWDLVPGCFDRYAISGLRAAGEGGRVEVTYTPDRPPPKRPAGDVVCFLDDMDQDDIARGHGAHHPVADGAVAGLPLKDVDPFDLCLEHMFDDGPLGEELRGMVQDWRMYTRTHVHTYTHTHIPTDTRMHTYTHAHNTSYVLELSQHVHTYTRTTRTQTHI